MCCVFVFVSTPTPKECRNVLGLQVFCVALHCVGCFSLQFEEHDLCLNYNSVIMTKIDGHINLGIQYVDKSLKVHI